MSLLRVWDNAQPGIREKIGESSYDTWFANLKIKEKDNQTLVVEAPDEFFKSWLVDHYQTDILDELNAKSSHALQLEFAVNSQIVKDHPLPKPKSAYPENRIGAQAANTSTLNNRFTFDNFVVGPSNRFASAASHAVAESPAKAYNPLFIYGQVGLGKTHLIQSITHQISQLHPQLKIRYMSSEQFTNELIDAIRHRSTANFRKKYRNIDVLLIDDIHFIAGKESTQEEFFHTFNNLHNNHKQIIITSDRPPKEIDKLEERLSSRFAWGLITDIQPPDYETRVAILRKKLENEPVQVPDDVIHFIAEEIKTNIRELEGALIRVAAYSMLEDKPVSLEMAKLILKDMVKETMKTISIEMVQKSVSEYFQVPLSEIRAKKRNKNVVLARQVAMYLSRQLANRSLPEIGNAFGGKDHTTVLHSCKKIEHEMTQCNNLKNAIGELTTTLKQ